MNRFSQIINQGNIHPIHTSEAGLTGKELLVHQMVKVCTRPLEVHLLQHPGDEVILVPGRFLFCVSSLVSTDNKLIVRPQNLGCTSLEVSERFHLWQEGDEERTEEWLGSLNRSDSLHHGHSISDGDVDPVLVARQGKTDKHASIHQSTELQKLVVDAHLRPC